MMFVNLLFLFCFAFAQETTSHNATNPKTFEELFKEGVQNYQAKKFEDARDAFFKASEIDPTNSSALTNLALAQFQTGKKGYAVALLRKASTLDPDFSTPKTALQFILPQLEVKEVPHEIQLWENIRSQLLVPIPEYAYLLMTCLLLLTSGWIFLSYAGSRRKAIQESKPFPAFPLIGTLLALGFLFSTTMVVLKSYDFQIPRGTIVVDKVAVLSAPEEKAAALFELYAGLEVIIQNSKDDWAQVTYPGAMTGWVPKSSLLHTTGKSPW